MKIGRNDPCPCGSGRKYKQCCLARETLAPPESDEIAAQRKAHEWLGARFGRQVFEATCDYFELILMDAEVDDQADGEIIQAFMESLSAGQAYICSVGMYDWLLCEARFERQGRSARGIDWVLGAGALRLTPPQRAWLEAVAKAPFGIHRVIEVEAERGLLLQDLRQPDLSPQFAEEKGATRSLVAGDVIAARICRFGNHVRLSGCIYPLSRLGALELLASFDAAGEDAASDPGDPACDAQHRLARDARNAWIGDRLTPWLERLRPMPAFESDCDFYAVEDRAAFEAAMAACPALGPSEFIAGGYLHVPEDAEAEALLYCIFPDEEGADAGPDRLKVFSMSPARQDQARDHFESVAGASARHLDRGTSRGKPLDEIRAPHFPGDEGAPGAPAAERTARAQAYYEEAYAGWADAGLPIFDNRSPRDCLATAAGSVQVELLLEIYDETEAHHARAAGREPVDFGFLRAALGLAARPA
jgi:hypothetical protein